MSDITEWPEDLRVREWPDRAEGTTVGEREEERVRLEERERVIRAVNAWARERWDAEVAARPRQNVYYNVLDTTWMQVRQLSMDDLEPHLEGNGGDDA